VNHTHSEPNLTEQSEEQLNNVPQVENGGESVETMDLPSNGQERNDENKRQFKKINTRQRGRGGSQIESKDSYKEKREGGREGGRGRGYKRGINQSSNRTVNSLSATPS